MVPRIVANLVRREPVGLVLAGRVALLAAVVVELATRVRDLPVLLEPILLVERLVLLGHIPSCSLSIHRREKCKRRAAYGEVRRRSPGSALCGSGRWA